MSKTNQRSLHMEEILYALEEIRRGDHLCRNRGFYKHHYIVENVDISRRKISVIHYNNNVKDGTRDLSFLGSLGRVQRDNIDFEPRRFHRIIYIEKRYSPQEVVERARSKLGETEYDLLNNNCEHFATWCKTGEADSKEVTKAKSSMKNGVKSLLAGVAGGAIVAGVGFVAGIAAPITIGVGVGAGLGIGVHELRRRKRRYKNENSTVIYK